MNTTLKTCTVCNAEKSVSEFYFRQVERYKRSDPYQHLCKECSKARRKTYRADPIKRQHEYDMRKLAYRKDLRRSREYNRQRNLKRFKGLDHILYAKLNTLQQGLCAICGQPETAILNGKVKPLAVDHCHVSLQVRGLLCSKCNTAIGLLNDSPDIAEALVSYLLNPIKYPLNTL